MDSNDKRKQAALRQRIMRVFSSEEAIRLDALDALREAWELDKPLFRDEELAALPAQNVTLKAAKRDGIKEVIDWLAKFHH